MLGRLPSPNIDELLTHAGWLNRLAHHLVRDAASAEDAVQEVWLAAQRSPPDADRPARPWLGEVLRNVVRMRIRRDGSRSRVEREVSAPTPPDSPEATHERLGLQRLLVESVMALDESLRTTVVMRFLEERSSAEIARLLGIPPGTVRWRLKTAIDRLRVEMDQRCAGGRRQWTLVFAGGAKSWTRKAGKAWTMAQAKGGIWTSVAFVLALAGVAAWFGVMQGRLEAEDAGTSRTQPAQLTGLSVGSGSSFPPPAAADGGSIVGRVLAPNGVKVADASVVLVRTASDLLKSGPIVPVAETRSNAQGGFTFSAVAVGDYSIAAMARGHAPGRVAVIVGQDAEATVDIELGTGGTHLRGRVLDSGGGVVPHAIVTAVLIRPTHRKDTNPFVLRAFTDEQGNYVLYARHGNHSVRVEAAGYASAEEWINLVEPRTHDFEMAPAARLSGHVRERASGQPVARAEVMLRSSEERPPRLDVAPALTDENGHFVFSNLVAGAYLASARSGPWVSASRDVVVASAENSVLELTVDQGRSVSGHVRDHEGRPVAGAAVQITSAEFFGQPISQTVSAANGAYRVEGLLPGVVRLRAKLDSFGSMNHHAVTLANVDLKGIDLRLDRPAIIEGQVLGPDGEPVPDIDVIADTADRRPDREMYVRSAAAADDQGRFAMVVAPSQVKVMASGRSGHARAFADLGIVAAGETRKVLLRLTEPGRGRIGGKVIDQDGRPCGNLPVTVESGRFSTLVRTDTAGTFVVDQLDAGAYGIIARTEEQSGYQGPWNSTRVDVKLHPGEERSDLLLTVPALGTIAGQVLDHEGQPVSNATILVSPEQSGRTTGGPPRRAASDEDGRFAIADVPRHLHTVTGLHDAHPNVVARGVRGGRTDVVVRFLRASQLTGAVVDGDGRPITDYLLRVQGPNGALTRGIHDPAGQFRISRLVRGSHTLSAVTASGQRGSTEIKIVEGESRGGITITLASAIDLPIRVVDAATGNGIAGATARASTEMSEQTRTAEGDGRLLFQGLPRGGRVTLFVEALGYGPVHPRIDVPATVPSEPVAIELKPLAGL
jgi:RNA polymerase sigma-70 factor (ECF subfamily)